jgi:hypothetical protein
MTIPKAKNIELMPLEDLRPYDRNARLHTRSQIEKIAKSIAAFGFNNPILIDSEQGIIAGHGRLEAAKFLGLETAPVIRLDHLSETERRAYILADNRLADLSQWDEETLSAEVDALQEADLDLDAIGWTEDELAALMAEVPDPEDFEDDELGSTVSDESEPETKAFRFEFDPTDFAELSQLLTDLRKKYKLDSDAETFEHLVRGAHG